MGAFGLSQTQIFCLVVGGLLAAAAGWGLWIWWRHRAWRSEAAALGFSYLPNDQSPLLHFRAFRLFDHGQVKRFRDVIKGRAQGAEVVLGDYRYTLRQTIGSRRNSRTYTQTVCIVRDAKLALPHFYLRRQRIVLDWLGKAFGGQDIDFAGDPEFSGSFVLQGREELAVRNLFNARARSHFNRLSGWGLQVEGYNDALLLHYGRTLRPARARDLMHAALETARVLAAAQRTPAA